MAKKKDKRIRVIPIGVEVMKKLREQHKEAEREVELKLREHADIW